MKYAITEMFGGEVWVSSFKPHLGWDTVDKVCKTLDEAKEFCGTADYDVKRWFDRGWFEPADRGQDYSSYAEKELAYDYWEA